MTNHRIILKLPYETYSARDVRDRRFGDVAAPQVQLQELLAL